MREKYGTLYDLDSLSWMDFKYCTNCTVAVDFLIHADQDFSQTTSDVSLRFVDACLSKHLADNITPEDVADRLLSHSQPTDDDLLSDIFWDVIEDCDYDYCHSSSWSGDPDLAGIGVLITYGLQISFSTALIIAGIYFNKFAQTKKNLEAYQRILKIYWTSSFYIGAGLMLASILVNAIQQSQYTLILSLAGAQMSIAVIFCLWPWYIHVCQHPFWPVLGSITMITAVLAMSAFGIYLRVSDYTSWFYSSVGNRRESRFIELCMRMDLDVYQSYEALYFLLWTPLALLGVCIIICPILWCIRRKRKLNRPNTWLLFALSFPIMWLSFAFILWFRMELQNVVGDSYKENEWGFGQVLVLATWLPIFIQISKIWVPKNPFNLKSCKQRNVQSASESCSLIDGNNENNEMQALARHSGDTERHLHA